MKRFYLALFLSALAPSRACNACADKLSQRPEGITVSYSSVAFSSPVWLGIGRELLRSGFLHPNYFFAISQQLLEQAPTTGEFSHYASLENLQSAVDRVGATVPGQAYLQLIARWSLEIAKEVGNPSAGQKVFLSILNRRSFLQKSAQHPFRLEDVSPMDLVCQLLCAPFPSLEDFERMTLDSRGAQTEEFIFLAFREALRIQAALLIGSRTTTESIQRRIAAQFTLLSGSLLPSHSVFEFPFSFATPSHLTGKASIKKDMGSGILVPLFPFQSFEFTNHWLSEFLLKKTNGRLQTVGGLLGLKPEMAYSLLQEALYFLTITESYADVVNARQLSERLDALSKASQPPKPDTN
jgi:hypothetical protein